jgi:hypothetical protein
VLPTLLNLWSCPLLVIKLSREGSEARYRAKARAEAEEYIDSHSISDRTSLDSLHSSVRGGGEAVATVAAIDIAGEAGRGSREPDVGIGIDDLLEGVEGAVATVAEIDIAGDEGRCDLDVVGPARVGVIRGRGIGIRVGVVEALIAGGIASPCDLRLGVVGDEDGGLVQREAEGIVFFVGMIWVPCSIFMELPTFDVPFPGPTVLVGPEPGGRIVILLSTFGEPGVTPGSCNWYLATYH